MIGCSNAKACLLGAADVWTARGGQHTQDFELVVACAWHGPPCVNEPEGAEAAIRPSVATQDWIDHDVPCHAVVEALQNLLSVLQALVLHPVELSQGLRQFFGPMSGHLPLAVKQGLIAMGRGYTSHQ